MTVAHPIARAWISTGGPRGRTTGAQNYDEFADDAEITEIIAANPSSALAVEMPHRAPENVGRTFTDSLPDAVDRLQAAKADGRYAAVDDVIALYRVSGPEGVGYGIWCMVDTDQISTSADEPGLIIRNEDVFVEKVRERVALAQATGHLLSPVLLLQTAHAEALHRALELAVGAGGDPVVTDVDPAGRTHAIWVLGAGDAQAGLLELAGGGELVVADGNHRSLAAQLAGLPRFLAVVTTPPSVAIQPYNRLVADLPVPAEQLIERLTAAGAQPGSGDGTAVEVYTRGGGTLLDLPFDPDRSTVENLDHARVERVLFADVLGLDAGDKRINYVGGDYPAKWLRGEVDAGRAELAVIIPPVTVDDFVAVNLARQKLPRKSTWFTPKARAGLVVAELSAESAVDSGT